MIRPRLCDLGSPTTREGVRASARAVVAIAPKDADGQIQCCSCSLAEWLGDWCKTGGASGRRIFSLPFLDREWGVEWILRLAAAETRVPAWTS